MPKAKQAQAPPRDDPAQSEKFLKDAAELMSADGAQLFECTMEEIAKSARLPVDAEFAIIDQSRARTKVQVKGKNKKRQ